MSEQAILDATQTAGAAIGEAVGIFMLHPETLGESVQAGYDNPFAGYVAGRGGVLGEATATTVSAVFVVFAPEFVRTCWDAGLAVRGAAGAAALYWDQVAGFAGRHLTGAEGLARIARLGERVIEATPGAGLPLYAGWREMALTDDEPGRALQVMFVLRELRAEVHFSALTVSGVTPVEAHMLGHGPDYTRMFGWPEPFADGADRRHRYDEVEETTNRRMAEILSAVLSDDEIAELARLSAGVLARLRDVAPG